MKSEYIAADISRRIMRQIETLIKVGNHSHVESLMCQEITSAVDDVGRASEASACQKLLENIKAICPECGHKKTEDGCPNCIKLSTAQLAKDYLCLLEEPLDLNKECHADWIAKKKAELKTIIAKATQKESR